MNLGDTPDSVPISSQTIVVKPENQATITKSNGSRSIRFFLPDYVGYYKPSLSNFNFDIKMSGRGQPIPSRDAGCHSLFSTVRTHDGTGSALLESVEQYNTYVAQKFNYTRSEGSDNMRAEYEGVNQNQTCDNNLYWKQNGDDATGTNWSSTTIVEPSIARPVQFLAPLRTELYDTDQYIPCSALGGMRLELQLENYQRALEYTCNELGCGASQGMIAYPMATNPGAGIAAVGATQGAFGTFLYTGGANVPGDTFTINRIYEFLGSSGSKGFVTVKAVGNPTTGITEAEIYCLGVSGDLATTPVPMPGDVLTIKSIGGTDAVITCNEGVNLSGDGKRGNAYQQISLPLWASNGPVTDNLKTEALANALAGAGGLGTPIFSTGTDKFETGDGSVQYPYRASTPKATAAYNPLGCFPGSVIPFEIGDKVYNSAIDSTLEKYVGIVSGIKEYVSLVAGSTGSNCPELLIIPDRPAQLSALGAALIGDVLPGGITQVANAAGVLTNSNVWDVADVYGFTHEQPGNKVFFKDADRISPYTISFLETTGANMPTLFAQASNVVDYTISNFQYQIHQMNMPSNIVDADLAAANSATGLQIDLDTVETRQVNMASIQGPTSQLISIPNITRALGVLSVPLVQIEQRGLCFRSLRGAADQMATYQYELGQRGLVPNRPVPVEASSLTSPLLQTQATNEIMKCMDAFGVGVNNLNRTATNFSVGRQFSRRGMYMDLMAAGDLILKAQFDNAQTGAKLYCHFISHLRSINVSSQGFKIAN